MTQVPSGDSAGTAWSGRTLPAGGFDGDDGAVDPAVAQALSALESGQGAAQQVVAALAAARVLVPVVAVLGEGEQAAHGLVDKSADMAVVTLTAPDGRRALPVFSGLESLQQWDPTARPVPVDCRRAAVSAVAEGCDVMVLDPAGPVAFVVSRPAVWALGQGRAWVPAHEDPDVARVLQGAAAQVPGVVGLRAERGDQVDLLVVVLLAVGLDRDEARAAVAAVGERLQSDDLLRERVEGVQLRVEPAA
ncbi:SseB family protein [Angustibacter luteus]|uniref:SseB family protein n=1 Tax=Angustibacter luteus TaxID=658456 RepID=A0ABW1J9N0_9ACTN